MYSEPDNVPFLQKLFATIGAGNAPNEQFSHSIIELYASSEKLRSEPLHPAAWHQASETLCRVDSAISRWKHLVNEIAAEVDVETLANSSQHSSYKDPLSYFHEKFLQQYNPKLRESRGVYYTPDPVVSYIVRSIDFLLRSPFDRQNGLADISDKVLLLDPACGTGNFLQAVIKLIRDTFQGKDDPDGWQEFIHVHLLPHLFGFELLYVPYTIAHMKLAIQLAAFDVPEPERQKWAYRLQENEQPNIFLTNTLEEVKEALIKQEQESIPQILVVLGNPPFAGHSSNKGQWITSLIETYKEHCPELKKPGQAKWLSDDYVKFMRFAQWHIEQVGNGILAFITNHSYLDNPTFRGMRHSLLQSFDVIYILDLHGNRKKQEQAPDGSKDENVFDIQQGVAISIFVRYRDSANVAVLGGREQDGRGQVGGKPRPYISGEDTLAFATVYHADLWGLRAIYQHDREGGVTLGDGKYAWLAEHDLSNTQWTTLDPEAPFYLFSPQESRYVAEYNAGWSVADIFRPNGDPAPGVVTCHDQFAISWTKHEACAKIERFLSTEIEAEARQIFRLCSQSQWQYPAAKRQLQQNLWQRDITEILYRPFDKRWTIFNPSVTVHRRERVMRHMLDKTNIGLAIGRAGHVIDQDEWDIAFCTRSITDFNLYRRGGNSLFPLYLFGDSASGACKANLDDNFIGDCATRLQIKWIPYGHGDLEHTFGPEDIFAYMYALFYSPTYRRRYAPFLKMDFPRVPVTSNVALFRALCSLGGKLVSLHVMEKPVEPVSAFPAPGVNTVVDVCYKTQGQVWINATQYFDGVQQEVWNFSIGGYQICKKWLKDRKSRMLSDDDITHYQNIVAILTETCKVMHEIDAVIENHGGFPL
ncbi:MAG: type ISP restriction/modification enzyme [Ktedonobacteraceae bacterium]